jgi:hypothetical protein
MRVQNRQQPSVAQSFMRFEFAQGSEIRVRDEGCRVSVGRWLGTGRTGREARFA